MTQEAKPIKSPLVTDDQIDLIALAQTIWENRKTMFKAIIVAGIVGLMISLFSPREYIATTTMVPQTSSSGSKLGGLSSLAAMAGFNLEMGSEGEALSPIVYPQIVSSVPFQLELMNSTFTFSEVNRPVSLYEYYAELQKPGILSRIKYTFGLLGNVKPDIRGEKNGISSAEKGPIFLTKKQEYVRKILDKRVGLAVDSKQGFLTLTASFPEALLSAQVADQARELLQKYITRYKIEKVSNKLVFIEGRYAEKKMEFERAQVKLAHFRDQNKNVISALVRTEEERLQSEYSIAMNVYNELAKQLEQVKIQVKEETPVFSVLEPAMVPSETSKPKHVIILFVSLFLGGFAGIGWIIGKQYYNDIKTKRTT